MNAARWVAELQTLYIALNQAHQKGERGFCPCPTCTHAAEIIARARIEEREGRVPQDGEAGSVPVCIHCRDTGKMVVGGGRSGGGRMHPYITAPCTFCESVPDVTPTGSVYDQCQRCEHTGAEHVVNHPYLCCRCGCTGFLAFPWKDEVSR